MEKWFKKNKWRFESIYKKPVEVKNDEIIIRSRMLKEDKVYCVEYKGEKIKVKKTKGKIEIVWEDNEE